MFGERLAPTPENGDNSDLGALLRPPQRVRVPGLGDAVTWNLRWLTDPRTGEAQAKRALLLRRTDRGAVAMLQETHGDGEAAALCSGILPHVDVVHNLARPGPLGGLQGGVAILCPGPGRVMARRVLVPGCVVEGFIFDSTNDY